MNRETNRQTDIETEEQRDRETEIEIYILFNEHNFCTKLVEEYGLGQGLASPLKSDL